MEGGISGREPCELRLNRSTCANNVLNYKYYPHLSDLSRTKAESNYGDRVDQQRGCGLGGASLAETNRHFGTVLLRS